MKPKGRRRVTDNAEMENVDNAIKYGIERHIPDDEIVAKGNFHMERMDRGHIWFHVNGITFHLYSPRKITLVSSDELPEFNATAIRASREGK